MATERVSDEHTKILHGNGLRVYAHTINRLRTMSELAAQADGFYSDVVTPLELEGVLNGTWNEKASGSMLPISKNP